MSGPFDSVERTPEGHFRLLFFNAVTRVLVRAPDALGRHGFLSAYAAEAGAARLAGEPAWESAVLGWEAEAPAALPAARLRDAAGLDHADLVTLVVAGLPLEDPRFADLPLAAEPVAPRQSRVRLERVGLLDPDGGGRPDAPLWAALRHPAEADPGPGLERRPADAAVPLEGVIAAGALRERLEGLAAAMAAGRVPAVLIRGPESSGRRTVAGALAHALGRGLLVMEDPDGPGDPRWRRLWPLATALAALPVVVAPDEPGARAVVPRPVAHDDPVIVVAGRHGGVAGPVVAGAVAVELDVPGEEERRAHWDAALERIPDGVAARRLTGGAIRRAAVLARAEAGLAGREDVGRREVRLATRALVGRRLDALADRVDTAAGWDDLAVAADVLAELRLLELRCRHRERLAAHRGSPPGVRALFLGPSGTGKTLAASVVASALDLDLYRLDLATVVNRYLGETEKNLSRVLSAAEDADVVLLIDEGDALLTQRTRVQSANDRYANLETNYLLQRLDSFSGIVVVTTNAGDRIDSAFRRRLDAVVEFRAPTARERRRIWDIHLPRGHTVPGARLDEISARCALIGGDILNAAVHATLLALDDGGIVTQAMVEEAVRREYGRAGATCPLPAGEAP